ncbi:DUF3466 family protein [Adhaeretor mobilis]|uniref:Extracellular repeat protein, HAF family n=1 Tax=Adhaeretor mobilis TaxID=1930276 RepID=A0A517MSM3_9BACT|nr:DUF3466 family protein [Adhaeretor mobilis]QDS97881.1 hypothetical protein HG15A2_11490 [Adhaeretor mobilis]
MSRNVSPLFAVLIGATTFQFAAAVPHYDIRDLTPDGYTVSQAYDINSSGDAVGVAGTFANGPLEEAYFFYDHSAGTSTAFGVGTVSPREVTGFRSAAINDSGQIAGTAVFSDSSDRRGFVYSGGTSGAFTNLGTLPAATPSGNRPTSEAIDLNASGIATGYATSGRNNGDNRDAFVSTSNPIVDIDGDLTVATRDDRGRAINNAGLVVGSNEDTKATLFSGPTETVLLASTAYASEPSFAADLNESGQVVGWTDTTKEAFLYDSSGSVKILPQMGTGNGMSAKAINENGDIVGDGDSGRTGSARGYVYLADDATSYILEDHILDKTVPAVADLGDWGEIRVAWGINDDGWIVGLGRRQFTGNSFPTDRAYLLIPSTAPGDFDIDGDIDANDFLTWQRDDGTARGLATWQSNYGYGVSSTVVSTAVSTTVPEPTSCLLCLVVIGNWPVRRK